MLVFLMLLLPEKSLADLVPTGVRRLVRSTSDISVNALTLAEPGLVQLVVGWLT
jgi:hypothetical protein